MNSGRRIYRVLVVLTALAMLANCVPVPPTSLPPTPGSPGVADLLAQLADQDAGVRLRAAYQLGQLWPTDEDAVKALIQAAGDPDSQVRTVATYALGKTRQETDPPCPPWWTGLAMTARRFATARPGPSAISAKQRRPLFLYCWKHFKIKIEMRTSAMLPPKRLRRSASLSMPSPS